MSGDQATDPSSPNISSQTFSNATSVSVFSDGIESSSYGSDEDNETEIASADIDKHRLSMSRSSVVSSPCFPISALYGKAVLRDTSALLGIPDVTGNSFEEKPKRE